MEAAKKGILTPEMEHVLVNEPISKEELMDRMANGQIVIPKNINHKNLKGIAIGDGLSTKINVNLGISEDVHDYSEEMEKVDLAIDMGAHAIMDLSNYGKTNAFREELIEKSPIIIGTVPMYDAIGYLEKELKDITVDDFFEVVEIHCQDGVDFVTVHAAMNRRSAEAFRRSNRLTHIVSRGGSLLYAWMELNDAENPFYEYYDRLLEILYEYDVTISIGDALRPGSLHDATDMAQITELMEIGELTQRAWDKNVQVLVEGPGHIPMNEIKANMDLEKSLCKGAPFYVLGPLVTDVFPGYDHITSAIGGAIAASHGANFLCYVTPAEHLCLPDLDDVREGIVASIIAAHAADVAKGLPGAIEWDHKMSELRQRHCWEEMFELTVDKQKARDYFYSRAPEEQDTCSMCGKMCPMRNTKKILNHETLDI